MPLGYCGEMVRKHDPDRFLLSLFEKPALRPHLWALYAFNHEIAKTREVVTETQLGLIRLQWWRDAVGAIYAGAAVPEHQVLQPLADAIRAFELPQETFDNLMFAREFDLEDRLPANLDGMVHYADFTSTPLLQLAARITGGDASRDTAIAYALTGLLRATPYHLAQRRCYLPEDLIGAQAISVYDLYDGTGIAQLSPVVVLVAERAREFLSKAPKSRMRHMTRLYLDQLAHAGHDVFSARLRYPPPLMVLRLWARVW
jgi:phytoene synthase